jgi:sugar lactone lactonase YvrE
MKNFILPLFVIGAVVCSCKKTLTPNQQGQLNYNSQANKFALNGIVASNDSAFNVVHYAGSDALTAGNTNGTSGDPTTAQFNSPEGIVFDSNNNMFVADRDNEVIRKITPAGVVSVFAGTLGVLGFADGTGTAAKFDVPIRLAIDGANNLYVADRDNAKIRKITPAGVVSTIAGSTAGSGATQFDWPVDVAVTADGTKLYVADSHNNRIQKITLSGGVYTTSLLAGQLTAGYAGGVGAAAQFNSPSGVAIDSRGYVLVADRYNDCIREITTTNTVYRYAGVAGTSYDVDAPFGVATFGQPYGITVANDGCVYVSDILYHNVRRISNHGMFVSTVAGSGGVGSTLGQYSSFNLPTSVAIDNSGNFYVADASNNNIRKLVPETRVLQVTEGWTQTTPFPGVTWYKFSNNRFYSPSAATNKTQLVNVLDIDLSVNHLVFKETDITVGHRESLTDIVGIDPSVLAAMTGTFATYETSTATPRHHSSYLRINGTTLWDAGLPNTDKYWPYHSAMFYINSDGSVGMEQSNMSQSPFTPTLHNNMMSGAPLLILNSNPVELATSAPWNTPVTDPPQTLRSVIAARSVLAISCINNHILLINAEGVENGHTCYVPTPTYYGFSTADIAQFIQQYFHAQAAENFDGGGTSTMGIKGFGDNGGVAGGIGIVNFPAWDSTCPATITPYALQRLVGDIITVVHN